MQSLPTPRLMSPQILSALLLYSNPSLAIIDVRDSDHVGGHIRSSIHVPSSTLDYRLPELVRTLREKENVVFHCALSQQRGPGAARRYLAERGKRMKDEEVEKGKEGEKEEEGKRKEQVVWVLEGGFVRWQERYGTDERLTEDYKPDIWEDH